MSGLDSPIPQSQVGLMIKLQTAHVPARVVNTLMLRGSELPPLRWHEAPIRAARSSVEAVSDDRELLDCETLVKPGMGAVVRALLLLWNGWPEEAGKAARGAPDTEQAYILALIARQAGDPEQEKEELAKVNGHPIFAELAKQALDTIGESVEPLLKRFRGIVEFGEQWEPHAFADIFDQACAGQFDEASCMTVRMLQCREVELLLTYCLEAAVGKNPAKRQQDAPVRRQAPARPKQRPRPAAGGAEKQAGAGKAGKDSKGGKPGAAPKLQPLSANSGVSLACPRCGDLLTVPESARGQSKTCEKCGATFLIPEKSAAAPAS